MNKLFKVCIAQADSGVESEIFWQNNNYYEENQHQWPGITKFGRALIDHTLQKTDKAIWAMQNAEPNDITSSPFKHWVKRIEVEGHWVVYDIYVNLDEKNFIYWKLKHEKFN